MEEGELTYIVMPDLDINIRPAVKSDLDAINRVIKSAVMTWKLPERVIRLSLPSYLYTDLDFVHFDMVVAIDQKQNIVGVAAWEQADSKSIATGQKALLLHGIYVAPECHRKRIGQKLLRHVEEQVRSGNYDGLLVKAQGDASDFFIAQGMSHLPVEDPSRDYTNRFWKWT